MRQRFDALALLVPIVVACLLQNTVGAAAAQGAGAPAPPTFQATSDTTARPTLSVPSFGYLIQSQVVFADNDDHNNGFALHTARLRVKGGWGPTFDYFVQAV